MNFEYNVLTITYRRSAIRKGEREPTEQPKEDNDSKDSKATEAKEAASTLALQQLIARVLVDQGTTIPLDSSNLHRKV